MSRYAPLAAVLVVVAAGSAAMYPLFAGIHWGQPGWRLAPLLLFPLGGYRWGRWKALLWLGVVPWIVLSLLLDGAWAVGLWDRSDEYEPLPTTPFLVGLGVPVFCGLTAIGVALRRSRRRPVA